MADAVDPEQSELDAKKAKEKEITVVQDQGYFTFETGDTYDGFFEAKKKDRSVKMHGPGVYTTAEGDSYTGVWENDKLGANESVTISYTDGSQYEGQFKDWCYQSHGTYMYPDGSLLQSEFVDNSPVGKLRLTDPNGHTWLGKAAQGFGWFDPVNHYFEMLETTRAPSKIKRRNKDTLETNGVPGPTSSASSPQTKKSKSPLKSNKSMHQ